jgi:hypothetical protein
MKVILLTIIAINSLYATLTNAAEQDMVNVRQARLVTPPPELPAENNIQAQRDDLLAKTPTKRNSYEPPKKLPQNYSPQKARRKNQGIGGQNHR